MARDRTGGNTVLLLLSFCCVFLLLLSLGTFDGFAPLGESTQQRAQAQRMKAVTKAQTLKLAIVIDEDKAHTTQILHGVELAVELVNEQGGALGKKLELVTLQGAANQQLYCERVQQVCDQYEVAALIGPLSTDTLSSARALTQFAALPLVSPVTVVPDTLPVLQPDNYVTFFPALSLWVEAVLNHMHGHGVQNLLIISPQSGSYGDIFSAALERSAGNELEQVLRINFQEPLRMRELRRAIVNYDLLHAPDSALLFAGEIEDLPELLELLSQVELRDVPLYGTDNLVPPLGYALCSEQGTFYLPEVSFTAPFARYEEFVTRFATKYGYTPDFHGVLGAECIFALAQALEDEGHYDPVAVVQALKALTEPQPTLRPAQQQSAQLHPTSTSAHGVQIKVMPVPAFVPAKE